MQKYKFFKLEPDIYISNKTGKGIIIIDEKNYFYGKVKIKKDKYIYFQDRNGKKIIDKYMGIKKPEPNKYWN